MQGKFLVCFVDKQRLVCSDTQTHETVVVAEEAAGALTATRLDNAVVLSWVALAHDNAVTSALVYDSDPVTYSAVYRFADSGSMDERASHLLSTTMAGDVLHVLTQLRDLVQNPVGCVRNPQEKVPHHPACHAPSQRAHWVCIIARMSCYLLIYQSPSNARMSRSGWTFQ